MKKLILLICYFFPLFAFPQPHSDSPKNETDKFTDFFPLIVDLGYEYFNIKDVDMHGVTTGFYYPIREQFSIGLGFDASSSRKLSNTSAEHAGDPQSRFFQVVVKSQYSCNPDGFINPVLDLSLGYGNWSIVDLDNQSNYNYYDAQNGYFVSYDVPDVLVSDGYFILQPGAELYFRICDVLSLGAGLHYRFSNGSEKIVSDIDMNNYFMNIGLRSNL